MTYIRAKIVHPKETKTTNQERICRHFEIDLKAQGNACISAIEFQGGNPIEANWEVRSASVADVSRH